jgi:hypothetical protein
MISKALRKRAFFVICLMTLGSLMICPPPAGAQQPTHVVEKGDTLWSISEKYYGDADLWPKLWQMNPFITNPHFLNPGDVITLLEEEPQETAKAAEEEAREPVVEEKESETETAGIDLSGFTNVEGLGYLSRTRVTPWGRLFFTDSSKLILGKGDKVFVDFGEREGIRPGQEFTVYKNSDLLRHPLTDKKLGHAVSFLGTLVIRKHLEKGIYESDIVYSYKTINIGDPVIPRQPVSPCIKPLPTDKDMLANIVSSMEQQELIGQFSIVFLDKGFNQGVRRGNVFEVVRIKKIHDPDVETMTLVEFIKHVHAKKTLADFSIPQLLKRFSKERAVYHIPLGRIMVVESRPDTATALVMSSKEDFQNGAFVKGVTYTEEPEFLAAMPRCDVE